jgi:hypothetical protein
LDSFVSPPVPPAPSQSGLAKALFFISLIIFLGVAGSVAYTLYKGQDGNPLSIFNPTPEPTIITEAIPTSPPVATVCQLNDKQYALGESFAAADGCNTCTCQTDLTITCTEMDCAVVSPTQSATTSSVPKDWKLYQNPNLKFSLNYPSSFKIADNLQKNLTDNFSTKNTLKLDDTKNGITILLMVNPDGFGPFFPDKQFKLSLNNDIVTLGKPEIGTENLVPEKANNIYFGELKTGFSVHITSWMPRISVTESEKTIEKIITTIKLTK